MSEASDTGRRYLSSEERAEYEEMLREIVALTTVTPHRLDAFERLLVDAIQAQRPWAGLIHRACLRDGMAAEIKRFQDRDRALVGYDGRVLNLPKVQGVKRRQAGGAVVETRELIQVCTWEQIEEKRREALAASKRYTDKVAHYDRLLALRNLAPEAITPQEAVEHLGIDIDEWLVAERSSA